MPRLLKGEGSNQGRVTGTPDVAKPDPLGVVSTVEKIVKPTFSSPTAPPPDQNKGRPIPVLQAHGYHGSIEDVNSRLEQITNSFTAKFGSNPTPGLAFDLLRAPVDNFDSLFDAVPPTDTSARLKGLVQSSTEPHERLARRADGTVVPAVGVLDFVHQAANQLGSLGTPSPESVVSEPKQPTQGPVQRFHGLAKKYPWVAAGYALPVGDTGAFYQALSTLNKLGAQGDLKLTDQGVDLSGFQHEYDRSLSAAHQADIAAQTQGGSGLNRPAVAKMSHDLGAIGSVKTVTQAQQVLNKAMGTHLPELGVINETWAKALDNWMRSASYFRTQTQFQAQNAGFGNDVKGYIRSWKNKQAAMHHNGAFKWFFGALPLPVFSHEGPGGTFESLWQYVSGGGGDPASIGLHSLTRTAGLGFDTVGGTVSQMKADASAGVGFTDYITPKILGGKGATLEQAKQEVSKALKQHPSWLRVFFPDAPHTGAIGTLDAVTNVAGDLVLLRKATFTGERIAAGDAVAASKSPYITSASHWAYQDLAEHGPAGIGRAASRLEGSMGGKRLVTALARQVQRGKITEEQFRSHVSDLFTHGQVQIELKPASTALPDKSIYFNQFGDSFDQKLLEGSKTVAHNIHDEHGNVIGSMVYDARKDRPSVYVESVFIRPEFRNVENFKRLVSPLLGDGRQIQADFENQRLRKLFERATGRGLVSGKALKPATGRDIVRGETPQAELPALVKPREASAITIEGPLLDSLLTDKLPTPGKAVRTWEETKQALRSKLDTAQVSLEGSNKLGTDLANSFLGSLRTLVAHAIPHGPRGYFDAHLPEGVFNYSMKTFNDPAFANKLESDLVRFQAAENIRGIQSIQRRLEKRYHAEFPDSKNVPNDPFEALLSTEAPSLFRFPGGGKKEITGAFGVLRNTASSINEAFNKLAVIHSRIILSGLPIPGGGLSLFWKHAVGDALRRYAGGGYLTGTAARGAQKEIDTLAASDPALSRALGTFLARTTQGETRWALGRGGSFNPESFSTGARLGQKQYMTGAGGYLRRLLDDNALTAYQSGDLTQLILKDKTYRGMWKSARKENPELSAEDYAALVNERFKGFEDAGKAAGIQDPLNEALKILQANRGAKADVALGKWINENKLDFGVKQAHVAKYGTFDDLTGRYVGNVIMAPNKLHRAGFAKAVLAKTFAELKASGFTPQEALQTGMSLAEKQVGYHMLDFVNRLQVEQDLRWVSYFATKHRLYWKWVLSTAIRHPGYAAAVTDFAQHLGSKGQIDLTLFGHKLAIPAARLVWVPGREYSEVSPLAGGIWNVVKSGGDLSQFWAGATGTYGNVIGRSDTAIRLGIKLARMSTGNLPSTYGQAISGMDVKTKQQVWRAINEYQLTYYGAHGHYAPEQDAVKHVLLGSMEEELWRANLPLPVVPNTDRTAQQKLMAQYMLLSDPKDRRKFLAEHRDLATHFGIYQDPKLFLNNQDFFARYVHALDAYHAARRDLYDRAKKDGWSAEIQADKHSLDAAYRKSFDKLLVEDAKKAGVDVPNGQVPDGSTIKYGPWGKLVSADPSLDPGKLLSHIFPNLKQTDGKVYGALQKELQQELSLLNNPAFARSYPDPHELKTRKREILQALDAFRGYPTDALGKLQLDFWHNRVDPYWKENERRYQAIKVLPREKQDAAWAEFRAWRDAQDHSVTVDGVKFPSPIRLAWASQDPQTREARMRLWAAKDPAHLTDYELSLLGKKVPPGTSQAWDTFARIMAALHGSGEFPQLKALAPGTKLSKKNGLEIAKYVQAGDPKIGLKPSPGFYKAFLFHKEPTYKRLQVLSVVTDSPYQSEWHHLLVTEAGTTGQYLDRKGYVNGTVRDAWKRYAVDPNQDLQRWLLTTPRGFQNEVSDFGPNFLQDLLN